MDAPAEILARLSEIPGYVWDHDRAYHSSYDNWHFSGTRTIVVDSPPSENRPPIKTHKSSDSETRVVFWTAPQQETQSRKVVARVSSHILRLEREFHFAKNVIKDRDPQYEHFVRPLELIRLPSKAGSDALVVSVFEAPGPNYLRDLVELGPNAYNGTLNREIWDIKLSKVKHSGQTPLLVFLNFAIGAAECCEILHHGDRVVHGELRGDAFHFNRDTGAVKMVNFGSGARSFENGLTSAGWTSLNRQVGVEHKLQFIAPEQTGRLPAEPDSRTDIYSLGILFWTMLTGEPAFDGKTPLDIMQNVLSRRLPSVSSKRLDIPEVLSSVIQKMTQKNIDDRYNSASGLKYDLVQIQKMLYDGDGGALRLFKIGSKDVSSFFNLPSHQIGRQKERQIIVNIIEKATQRQKQGTPVNRPLHSLSSNSTTCQIDDLRSDSISSKDSESGMNSGARQVRPPLLESLRTPQTSQESVLDSEVSKPAQGDSNHLVNSPEKAPPSGLDGVQSQRPSSMQSSIHGSGALLKNARKLRHKGRCEVISIAGAAGLGKSCLMQSIQVFARSHGYIASAKFDQARKTPFDSVLKLLSSVLRQIFSEADISTEFHNRLRTLVRPVWSMLHFYLDLPGWLLDPIYATGRAGSGLTPQGSRQPSTSDPSRTSSPTVHCGSAGNTAADWLRSGGSAKSSCFMYTILDLLKVLAAQKFICFYIDDLQFADTESLELLQSIVMGDVPIVLMLTHRQDDELPMRVVQLLKPATKIQLLPFNEDETAEYVCATLHRDRDYVLPLVAVLMERTSGNPFFVREMLDMCYRKKCLFFSWTQHQWEYDLDRIFNEFEEPSYGSQLNNPFVTKRLQELSAVARALLAWASLIGNTFSFNLVKALMRGDGILPSSQDARDLPILPSQDPVAGLHGALSSYIIMPCEDEDRFRFAHDRYMQAAATLSECYNKEEMHFIIAKTMVEQSLQDNGTISAKSLHIRSRHVCLAINLIRARVLQRSAYRDLLYEAAANACESGARSTGLSYYTHCISLLQDDPWNEQISDVNYQETLTLFTRTAECYWYQGLHEDAARILQILFSRAHDAVDKAPGWILWSRIFAVKGDSAAAFAALKQCLADLGLEIPETTWEECDAQFYKTRSLLMQTDREELLRRPATTDRRLLTMGAVLVELTSAAFWTNSLLFYKLSLVMIDIHLHKGTFPQLALSYVHFASVAVGRFGLTEFGVEVGDIAIRLLEKFRDDAYTYGRGRTLHALFIGHLQLKIGELLPALETAMEATVLAGDRILSLLNLGVASAFKLWASHNLADVEAFVNEAAMEFPDWQDDLRGGVFMVSVRQFVRALQGKTHYRIADRVMSDSEHESRVYLNHIDTKASNPKRPKTIYLSLNLVLLFRFGHSRQAIEVGEKLLDMSQSFWCIRFLYSNYLYLSLSYIAEIRVDPTHPDREDLLGRVLSLTDKIRQCASVSDVNYRAWICLLQAEYADVTGDYATAVENYEAALDHCETHGFTLDSATIYELYGEALVRKRAMRPARRLLKECLAAYRQVNALGKCEHVAAKSEWLVQDSSNAAVTDAACQTEVTEIDTIKLEQNENQTTLNLGPETSADRTQAWLTPAARDPPAGGTKRPGELQGGFSAVGLDMIDLASILESSQVMSSELKVDRLLSKMTEIILESTGADLGAIVVEDDEIGWSIAAVGDPDGVVAYPGGQSLETVDDQVAKQVTLYVLRFKEPVFVHNLLEDERFSSVTDSYLKRNPGGKSVIALPILHGANVLLGSIYIEGPPNSFTDRNLSVLRLLCNQISISLANALMFKRLERVSASNEAMLEMQKRALKQAREAEARAKAAQAEAIHNMKLKEEAAKAKSMFLANVSHELRTPLNGVLGMSELLKQSKLSSEQEGYADSIRVCADTLLSIINDLLDFTKLENGKMNMYSVPLSLNETIGEVVRALSYTNLEKGLKTIERVDINPHQLVLGDPVRLHQIFMNLLSNSYKFTSKGTVTVRAVVDKEDSDSIHVTCSVADTGIGIPEEQRKKLFSPFTQAENSSSRKFGGTGLGLSICKAIVENVIGGKIWLESTLGVGTTVSFSLRFKKARSDVAKTERALREPDPMAKFSTQGGVVTSPSSSVTDFSKLPRDQIRICIAEDNLINQKIAISFVRKLGFKCEVYGDGHQAVDALERASVGGFPFHLVLMDVQMPVLDGYDATRKIREHQDPVVRDVLVIAMTASAIRGDREKCLEAGMNNYLAKPVRAQTLKTLLESYLAQAPKPIPNLQQEATKLAKEVVREVESKGVEISEGSLNAGGSRAGSTTALPLRDVRNGRST